MRRARSSASPGRGQRGGALIELALLLPLLLVMAFGTSELGRAIYTYNTLVKTVRDAARHLSQHGPGDDAIRGEARCLAAYGNTTCSGTPIAPGLTANADPSLDAGMVVICDAVNCPGTHASQPTSTGGVINLVSVSIQGYTFNAAVTYVIGSTLNFNTISSTMRAQL